MADCPTRWSSADLMISCILRLRQHVTTVCQDIGWNNLLNSDWKIMEHYRDLPFANYNTLRSAEDLTIMSPNTYTDGADHAP